MTPAGTASPASTVSISPDLKLVPGSQPIPLPLRTTTAVAPRRRKRGKWIVAAVGLVAAALLAVLGIWRTSQLTTPIHYVTMPVTQGAITRAITASGSVSPEITVQVGTYVSGVIQELYCDYNTQVRKGQLCAKIDPRPYQTVVDQSRANLAMAKAQLAKDQTAVRYAQVTYQRTSDLRQRGIVSQDALDSAKSVLDATQAQLQVDQSTIEQRQAALTAAEINLTYTNIISPVNGTVVSRSVTMGQTVAASFQTPTLFLIATDLTKMQVDANVSESDIGGVKVGNSATFTVDAFPDHTFEGRVSQVRQAPQTVQNVVTYDVVISVSNADLLLKPGMTATVRVIVDRRDGVLRVPDQALRYTPSGQQATSGERAAPGERRAHGVRHLWVLRDGQPVDVPVTIGLDDDINAEVIQGELTMGDEVVTAEQTPRPSSAPTSSLRFFRF